MVIWYIADYLSVLFYHLLFAQSSNNSFVVFRWFWKFWHFVKPAINLIINTDTPMGSDAFGDEVYFVCIRFAPVVN